MLSWIIQISIISIIFIFLVHHLLLFFKSTLTVPKIKDLVNSPTQKYQNIFNIISNNSNNSLNTAASNPHSYTDIDLLPTNQETNNSFDNNNDNNNNISMKDELKLFLKKQLSDTNSKEQFESLL
jgi:hypothetical protein